jgi:hypothetical protein
MKKLLALLLTLVCALSLACCSLPFFGKAAATVEKSEGRVVITVNEADEGATLLAVMETLQEEGKLTFTNEGFTIIGTIRDEQVNIQVPVGGLPTLPFKPGKYLELQQGKEIYRCLLSDGKLVMKFINLVKIYYELHQNELNKEKVT